VAGSWWLGKPNNRASPVGKEKTIQPPLRAKEMRAPFGGFATTFPPQAGAQQPVLNVEQLFEANVYRGFIVPPHSGVARELDS